VAQEQEEMKEYFLDKGLLGFVLPEQHKKIFLHLESP
jgi:hypothetical protein